MESELVVANLIRGSHLHLCWVSVQKQAGVIKIETGGSVWSSLIHQREVTARQTSS